MKRLLASRRSSHNSVIEVPLPDTLMVDGGPEAWRWRQGSDLLSENKRVSAIRQLRAILGLSDQHFDLYYLRVLTAYAEFVQETPASENYHHSYRGGLLDHTIDVGLRAVKLRSACRMPRGGTPEYQYETHDLWTYAVFVAAFLHDVGKVLTDHERTMWSDTGQNLGTWCPWTDHPSGHYYSFAFRPGRDYRSHEYVGPSLAPLFVPREGLHWLNTDTAVLFSVFGAWRGDRETADLVGELVRKADSGSVGANIGTDPNVIEAQMDKRPLHQRIVDSMQEILRGEAPSANKGGALVFVQGNYGYAASKRLADAVRDNLKEKGYTDIPNDNNTIFDVLMNRRAIESQGGKATLKVDLRDEKFSTTLDMVKFNAGSVFSVDAWPGEFDGTLAEKDSNRETAAQTDWDKTKDQRWPRRSRSGASPRIAPGSTTRAPLTS